MARILGNYLGKVGMAAMVVLPPLKLPPYLLWRGAASSWWVWLRAEAECEVGT